MNAHSSKRDCGGIADGTAALEGQPRMPRWLHRHLSECETCRRRVLGAGRARWALLLVRTDPCDSDLLMEANRRAIGVVSRALRDLPQAERLRHARRRLSLRQHVARYTQGIAHAAACLLVLVLIRTGWLASLTRVHEQGTKIAKLYFDQASESDSRSDSL